MAPTPPPPPSASDALAPPPSPTSLLPLRAGEAPIGIANAAIVISATAAALAASRHEFLFYIAVMVALMAIIVRLHRRVPLSIATLWCLTLWGAAHMAGGMVPLRGPDGAPTVLYNLWLIPPRILKYDQLVHGFGFGVTTWVCWQLLRPRLATTARLSGPLALCALAAMGLGSVNEVIEFTATRVVPTNVGDYVNNALDLIANMTGALIAALLIGHSHRARSRSPAGPGR